MLLIVLVALMKNRFYTGVIDATRNISNKHGQHVCATIIAIMLHQVIHKSLALRIYNERLLSKSQ